MVNSFGIAFYHAQGKAKNLNVNADDKFVAYYKCIAVAFASIRRCYPEAKLILFSDRHIHEPYGSILGKIGAETVIIEGVYTERNDLRNVFPGCLFTLDVIGSLKREQGDQIFLLDPDVVMRRRIEDAVSGVQSGAIGALAIDYPINHLVQGQSRASLSVLAARCGADPNSLPIRYFGGEFYALPLHRASELSKHVESIVHESKILSENPNAIELTEEHVLSVALALEPQVFSANTTIKRIWTNPSFCNWEASDAQLPLWHLPGEKGRLFKKLFEISETLPHLSDREFDDAIERLFTPVPSLFRRIGSNVKGRASLALKALS